jgi:hypothetical protein
MEHPMGNLHTANKRHKRAVAVAAAAKPVEATPAATAKPKKAIKANPA